MPKKEYDFSAFDEIESTQEEASKEADKGEYDFSSFDTDMADLPEQKEEVGMGEATARGIAQGLSFGLADELTGMAEAGYEATFGEDKLKDILDNYRKYREESRKEYKQAEEEYPTLTTASEVAGGIIPALLTGGAALPALGRTAAKQALKSGATKTAAKMAGAKALAKAGAKEGALLGGAYSLGESEADLTKGEVEDLSKDIAIGTGVGALTGAASPFIGKAIEKGARVAGKGIKKASQYGLRKAADLESDIFQKILKDPKAIREAGEMTKSADDLIQQGNKVLSEASDFAQQARNKLDATEKYSKSFVESTFNKVFSTINPADRQSKRQLLNLKDDILNIKLKNKESLSDIDLQNVLDDVYELAYSGLKKDAADSTKKAIRQVGREISTTLKNENPEYTDLMKKSEDRFKFVTKLSDLHGMNRAGIEATEDAIEGSALKYTQSLEFPKRKKDTSITNLKKVIDPKKVDDKNFIENAVEEGFLSENFAKSNEARAIKELLNKDPNLKVGDLMSARALIGGAASGYMGGFLPYAFAVMSKPAARKLLTNMDRLGIKKGTEAADKYLEKLVTTGTLSLAMQDTKEVVSNNATERKNEIASNISSMKEGDLMDLAESVKEVNSSLYNQLINISQKPINKRKTYVQMLVSDPSKRDILTKAINKQNESLDTEEMQGVQNEEDTTNSNMPDTTSGIESKKKVENTREPSSVVENLYDNNNIKNLNKYEKALLQSKIGSNVDGLFGKNSKKAYNSYLEQNNKEPIQDTLTKNDLIGLPEPEELKEALEILGNRESGNKYDAVNNHNYIGKYQFGAQALETLGYIKPGTWKKWTKKAKEKKITTKEMDSFRNSNIFEDSNNFTGKLGVNSKEDFLSNKNAQEAAVRENLIFNYNQLKKNNKKYGKKIDMDQLPEEDVLGLLFAAHLKGQEAKKLYQKKEDSQDGYGTKTSDYFNLGYQKGVENRLKSTIVPEQNIDVDTPLYTQKDIKKALKFIKK